MNSARCEPAERQLIWRSEGAADPTPQLVNRKKQARQGQFHQVCAGMTDTVLSTLYLVSGAPVVHRAALGKARL